MRPKFFVAAVMIGSLCASMRTYANEVRLLAEGRDSVMQNWGVPRERWRSQPKWTPSSIAQPPLSIAKAVEAGEAWLRKRHPDISRLVVSEITLRVQAPSGSGIEEGWFYRVEFQPIIAGKKVWGADLVAVVLFDGTVVVPTQDSYSAPNK